MNKLRLLMLAGIACMTMIATSCEKEDPEDENEEEVITTLNYFLDPVGGGLSVPLTFRDLDGDGGDAPVVSMGSLQANTTYNTEIQVLNEQVAPFDVITEEIEEEAEEHQFFFQTNIPGVSFSYADQDANGAPLGLDAQVTTGDAGSGSITVTLRHEPNKSATGVSEGNIENAGGETDIEVTFTVNVVN